MLISFFRVDVKMLLAFFEESPVQFLAAEARHAHVSGLVSQSPLMDGLVGLLGVSLVDGFGLVELLSVLGSVLVCVHVLLGGPTGAIPQR